MPAPHPPPLQQMAPTLPSPDPSWLPVLLFSCEVLTIVRVSSLDKLNATPGSEETLPTALCQSQGSQGLKHQPPAPDPAPRPAAGPPLPPLIRAYSSINKHTLAHLARAPNSREFRYLVAVWWQKFAREQGKKGLIYFTGSLGAVLKTTWGEDRTGQGDQGKGRCSKVGRR